MQKEPKLPDDAQNLPKRLATPAGSVPDMSGGTPGLNSADGCPAAGAGTDPRPVRPAECNPYSSGMVEEDEINLLDLFIVLLKHKVMIFFIVFLAGVAAVAVSLTMENIYRSEATIAPTAQDKGSGALSALGGFGAMIASEAGIGATGSLEQFDVVLKSRELTNTVIQEHNLLPVIFDESWDAKTGKWKVGEPSALQKGVVALREMFSTTSDGKKKDGPEFPTLQDGYKAIQDGMLSLQPDKKQNVMKVTLQHKDPETAKKILDYYVVGLSEFLRRQTLEDAVAQEEHLSQQLARTSDPLLKNKLYELIAKQIENETLARVQKYYSFKVIDPAFVPEKKFKPKRAQICLLSVVVAFFLAVFLAFFLEYLKNLKTNEDPERLTNLRNAFRLRKK